MANTEEKSYGFVIGCFAVAIGFACATVELAYRGESIYSLSMLAFWLGQLLVIWTAVDIARSGSNAVFRYVSIVLVSLPLVIYWLGYLALEYRMIASVTTEAEGHARQAVAAFFQELPVLGVTVLSLLICVSWWTAKRWRDRTRVASAA